MDQKFSEFSHTHICFYTQQVILNEVSPKWIKNSVNSAILGILMNWGQFKDPLATCVLVSLTGGGRFE